jgi:hypothetical protein
MSETEPNDPSQASSQSGATSPTSSTTDSPTVAWTPPRDDTYAPAAEPVSPATSQPARRTSRLRWAVAGLVTVLVVTVTAGVTLLVTGQSSASSLVGYVDNTSFVYAEARLDLPGDQRQKLGQFLSKFPGFDDQSILDQKLDEALDQLLDRSTSGKQNWSTKIKPWFGGEIALGAAAPTAPDPSDGSQFHGLVAVKVRDGAAAMAWLKDTLGATPVTTQTYNGTEILIVGSSGEKAGAAIADGKALLIGDEASVRKAIDSHGNGTFAQSDGYKQARAALSRDHLGFIVFDAKAYMDLVSQLSTRAGSGAVTLPSAIKDLLPAWIAMSLRSDGDAIALEIALPHVAAMDVGDNRPSSILPHLPPSTIFVADGRDVGANWKKLLDLYRGMPGFDEAMKQLDTALNMVGGFDKAIGWIGDAALVVTRNGSTAEGGVVITPTDASAAQGLFSSLRNAIVLGGAQAGIKVSDENYNGTTITMIDAGDIHDLLSKAGASSAFGPEMPSGSLKFAYTVTDGLVIAGVGDTFVKAVLDTQAGSSLANDSRFKAAADRAGATNRGLTYVDIAAARELIENIMPAAERAEYERNYKPYLLPLQAFVVSNREDGSLDRAGEWLVVGN